MNHDYCIVLSKSVSCFEKIRYVWSRLGDAPRLYQSKHYYQQAIAWHLQQLSEHRKETASARYCSLFTSKLLSVTFGHVSRRARQNIPPYHSIWSTPTIPISSVHVGHSSTTLSASHHHAWQSGHSPSTVRKRSAQVSADM